MGKSCTVGLETSHHLNTVPLSTPTQDAFLKQVASKPETLIIMTARLTSEQRLQAKGLSSAVFAHVIDEPTQAYGTAPVRNLKPEFRW